MQHLKLGKLKFGIRKIGCSMSWTRYKFLTYDCQITLHSKGIIFYQTSFSLVEFLGSNIFGYKMSIPYHSTLEIKVWGNMFEFGWNKKNKGFEQKKSWIWYIYVGTVRPRCTLSLCPEKHSLDRCHCYLLWCNFPTIAFKEVNTM